MKPHDTPLSDPNEDFDPDELDAAVDETPTETMPQELSAKTRELVEWDEPPSSHGTTTPRISEENEEDSVSARLVYEGTDEADRERRIAASDPDFEP